MGKGRIEAFSDGVIAIILTIMVLELRVPAGEDLAALGPLLPVLGSYVLSFTFMGIYWNNHHHMFQACHHVSGPVLWANLHLLFWLSLTPVTTAWMGESRFAAWPVAIYGVVLLCSALAYYVLSLTLLATHEPDSLLHRALGSDRKGKLSLVFYLVAIPLAFVYPPLAWGTYIAVALTWLVPDRRFERVLAAGSGKRESAGGPVTLLERVVVSRKTPGDGRLMISAATAARLHALGSFTLERGGERAPARLHEMTCTCAKGGAAGKAHAEHVHHFVESPPLRALEPGSDVALELDEGAATLSVRSGLQSP